MPAETKLACFDCRLPYGSVRWADFVVADDVWAKLQAPEEGIVLCVNCMMRRAQVRGIEAEGQFTSGPFAAHHWRNPGAR